MNKQIINEGLDYQDMKNQVESTVSVDEYAAKMGKDCDIVTIAFIVNSEEVGKDLVDWFERGYDYILDASVSDGELTPGKYLVFVEMKRRTTVPEHIVEMLDDLETLTDLELDEWTITVDDQEVKPDANILKNLIPFSPHDYREKHENDEELNEMRQRAGLDTVNKYEKPDSELKAFISMAGL